MVTCCNRRLYKGNSYEICLPITDTGVTSVRFYTSGDMVIEKEGELVDDMMCFELTKEELDLLPDGVLRYSYDGFDSNTEYVIVTPGDYSGSTLDDLLEDAFDSGYTAGQEGCSAVTCEGVYESGYTSGYTDGQESVDCTEFYNSGVTDGFESGYTSGHTDGYDSGYTDGAASVDCTDFYNSGVTDGFESGYTSGKTDGYDEGWAPGYQSGYTDGVNTCGGDYASGYTDGFDHGYDSGYTDGAASVDCTDYYDSGVTDGFQSGYTSGHTDGFNEGYDSGNTDGFESGYTSGQTDGFESGYDSGYTDGVESVDCTDYYNSGVTDGFGSGYTSGYSVGFEDGSESVDCMPYYDSGHTDGFNEGYDSGKTDGFETGYDSGRTDGFSDGYNSGNTDGFANGYDSGFTDGAESVDCTVFYDSGVTDGFRSGYTSGRTDGYNDGWTPGYQSGFTDGAESVDCTDYFNSGYTSGYTDGNADLIANLQGDYFVIPEGTTRLRDWAFRISQNNGFSGIVIPNSVVYIGQYAFHGNFRLKDITIPSSVESIDNFAFNECSGLTAMTFEGATPPTFAPNYPLGSTAYTFPIYVPCESVEAYKTAVGQNYADRITCIPEPDYSGMPLTFDIISGGTIGWNNSQTNVNIEYSINSGQTWQNFTTLNVNAGDKVMFRGTGHTGFDGPDPGTDLYGSRFTASTGTYFNAVGNIHSLLNSNYTGITALGEYGSAVFFGLFSGNTGLVSAENLKLPAQTLVGHCYRDMFACCSNLTTAPELPAPDTYWAAGSYMHMFHSCYNLNYIKCLVTSFFQDVIGVDWVAGVSPTGTFVKSPELTEWPVGYSGIPTGWTVVDAQL